MDATHTLHMESAWTLLRWLARSARPSSDERFCRGFAQNDGHWSEVDPAHAEVTYDLVRGRGACGVHVHTDAACVALLELLMPICAIERPDVVVAHLGQSLDGRIATRTGASQFITAHDDVMHTHRLRALSDAVVVGASTVRFDDPRLTTRLVSGEHPVRVILDPTRRLASTYGVFNDALAPTLLVTSADNARNGTCKVGNAEVLGVSMHAGRFDISELLSMLRARGLRRIFVEGGGATVSAFLQASALDRLHLTVAPVILGSGVPGLALPAIDELAQALRYATRHFLLGTDVLFDCDTRTEVARSDQ